MTVPDKPIFMVFFLLMALSIGQILHADSGKNRLELSHAEKKALRREMTEMDIAIREMVSAATLNQPKVVFRRFSQLSSFTVASSPYYKNVFPSLSSKLKGKNLFVYFQKMHGDAAAAYASGKNIQSCNEACQNIFYMHYKKIITHCSECHRRVDMENSYFEE